jgi:hypothetical protein
VSPSDRGRSASPREPETYAGRRFAHRIAALDRFLLRALPLAALIVVVGSGSAFGVAALRIGHEEAAYSGPAAPLCVPERLNGSALLPHTNLTVSPMPGSRDASPDTQISFLGVPATRISGVRVFGSFSGAHPGRLEPYSQGDGGSFVTQKPFAPGERVEVSGTVDEGGHPVPFRFHFTVAYPDPIPIQPPTSKLQLTPGEYTSYHSAPELHPPTIDVTTYNPAVDSQGYIFAAPYSGPGNTGPMIFESDGQLVWLDPLPEHVFATNLQVEEYEGEKVLTWWQGYIPQNGFGLGEEIVANSSYQPILHIHAGNGRMVDLHDFHLEPDHTAVFTVFPTIHCNLSHDQGPRDGDVVDAGFQEVDLKTGLVRREWLSVDHVPLSASYAKAETASAEWPYDFFHINTVDPRSNGTILISARNTWQLYILDGRTDQVKVTIGGKDPSVRMEPGTYTAYQHDANTLPNGLISVFDNGGTPFVHPQTRGLVIELNEREGVVRKVFELVHQPPLQSGSQGNVQLLPNGNWFMGWGAEPYFTEFTPSGQIIYDAHLSLQNIPSEHGEHTASYRGYKFEWRGTPTYPPAIAVEASGNTATVYASWNGATEVARWEVVGGSSPETLVPLRTVPRTGFETAIQVPVQPYLAVEALDKAGIVIGRSQTVKG